MKQKTTKRDDSENTGKSRTKNTKNIIKKTGKKGGSTTMISTAAGAVMGATIGGLAGAALSDTKTRRMMGEKITDLAKGATETAKRLSEESGDIDKSVKDLRSSAKKVSRRN